VKILARPKNISNTEIEAMKALKSNGKSYEKISRQFNISEACVRYHLDPKYRESVKVSQSKQRKKPERKKWMADYFKNRYNNDKEFREKHLERVKRYQQNHLGGNKNGILGNENKG
jgi:hypothetical protein